jgi:hypothetical protein
MTITRRQCQASGCTKPTEGYSKLCNSHRCRYRRHGHWNQPTIRQCDLKPTMRFTAKWLDKSPKRELLWDNLRKAYALLIEEAEGELRLIEQRKACIRYKREAYQTIIDVAGDADRDTAILTVVGLAYMTIAEPRRFRSDRAAFVQCARRFRGLGDCHVAEYWSQSEGRSKRVYRDAHPQTAVFLGQLLMSRLGPFGHAIHSRVDEQRAKEQSLRTRTLQAITEAQGPVPV